MLPKSDKLNEYFQKSGGVITELDRKMREMYQELLLCYMKRDYVVVNYLEAIDPTKEEYYLSNNEIYLGVQLMTEIARENIQARPDMIADFQARAKDFIKP